VRDKKLAARLVGAMRALAENPRPPGCKKLRGGENLWRIRVGDFRVIYEIHDDVLVIVVVSVGNRRDVYR
jgi:mRNA interferase RelE/StbE